MKNILKGLVIVVVIVCFASCDDYKPTAKKYFQYEKNNDTCIITGLSEAGEALEALELVIPKKIEGKPVTIISNAFAKADNIVSVTIPNTIKEFSNAFSKCKNLEIVTFEDGISIIDATYRWLAYHSMLNGDRGDAIIIGASKINHLVQNMNSINYEISQKKC